MGEGIAPAQAKTLHPIARQDNRLFLDGRAGVCYCFSELIGKAGSPFHAGRDGACDSMRNEKRVKPLKGVCYCFSELIGKAGSPFHAGRDGACDSMRNEKLVKPLKTNNSAKWPISHP
jgi:hypothetical protein